MKVYTETIGTPTGGMNRFDPELSLSACESPFLQNLTWRGGTLCCRRGQVSVGQTLSGVLAAAPALFHGWLVLHAQETIRAVKLQQTVPADERPVGTAQILLARQTFPRTSGVFFRWREDLFYKTRGAYVRIRWNEGQDSLSATLLTDTDNGTPLYIPVIQINTDPDTGAGDRYQPENLLSGYKKVRFNAAAGVDDYHLPEQGIDAVQAVYVDGALTTHYAVNLEQGVVLFESAPPVHTPPVNNTVEICYRKTNATAAESILSCTAASVYGAGRDLCIVLGGGRQQPNAYYWTGNNGLAMDPTYFPAGQYNLAGDASDPITCFGRQQNMLVIFQTRAVGKAALTTTELSGRVQIALDYTRVNAAVGCDLPGTLRLVENNLVWCSRRHGVCRLRDTTAAAENSIAVLSRKINGDDARPGLLSELRDVKDWRISAAVFDDRYLLALGDLAYEWNCALGGADDPSWFFHRGIRTLALIPAEGGALFGVTEGGVIVSFEPVLADLGGPIEKICVLPPRTLGGDTRLKTVRAVLLTLRARAPLNTQVVWTGDHAQRRDKTNLTCDAWRLSPRSLSRRDLHCEPFVRTFLRKPGFFHVRHLGVWLSNNEAGVDLPFVSARILYSCQGRQR